MMPRQPPPKGVKILDRCKSSLCGVSYPAAVVGASSVPIIEPWYKLTSASRIRLGSMRLANFPT